MLAPPISDAEVRRVWLGFRKDLSADVLHLYTSFGGFQDYAFDDDFFWSLWPWDMLQTRNRETPCEGVVFCDHSIEVVTWEFRYENVENSSVWSSDGHRTASTVESFFERYLEDPWQLL